MSEKQLIKDILTGNTQAFGALVDAYQDMAFTIAYRVCKNRQDAEDITQNAFVKAYKNLHTFRFTSKFSSWFYRIVYNTALTHIQQQKEVNISTEEQRIENYTDLDSTDSALINKDQHLAILDAIHQLPGDEATIITLYYIEEKSIKEIEKITSLSLSNIKIKLYRARKRLAELLENTLK
ncbi:MAG: sigma-70 family RNA polymerase sigma factor [Brumimicrobium sp.]|nr:sigma-70 family RNA polymerase sigma factor [Brumimicrobium sp.]